MKYHVTLLTIVALSACSSQSWVKMDGSAADKSAIDTALTQCEYEKKRQLANRYLAGSYSGPEEKRKNSKAMHEKVYQGAIDCMRSKGLVKP